MDEIIVLNIKNKFNEEAEYIHPVVLKNDHEIVLIDCGYIGYLPELEKALEVVNLSGNRISKVVITHQDHDHMGALRALKQKYPMIKVVASTIEAPYITGEKYSLRLEQAEALQATLPEEQKSFGEAFINLLKMVETVPVDIMVKSGDMFDWGGGCEIIATPGHTLGHISLYLREHQTIITGDAAVLENNRLTIANPQFTLNRKEAESSLQLIESLPAMTYICYHGGVLTRKLS